MFKDFLFFSSEGLLNGWLPIETEFRWLWKSDIADL